MSWLNGAYELHSCLVIVCHLKLEKDMIDNGYLLCFRWLELLAKPRKVSGQIRPAVPINRHRHLQI
jgi:hypothetical protein